MGISVIKAGLLTTLQDLGRFGYRKDGIIVSGAMDLMALKIGNLLLGNPEQTAGLECTLQGPELLFESNQLIAITGGDLSPQINDAPVKMWRPHFIKKGNVLKFGAAIRGCRAYITVFGGFDIPVVLGSGATYLKAGFGGWEGRALKKYDVLPFKNVYSGNVRNFNWSLDLKVYPDLSDPVIRILEGPEYHLFSEKSKWHLSEQVYLVTKEADRMGYRLEGPVLGLVEPKEMLSAAVAFGTIQVTGKGDAIVLMADHQTTGGYPRIAQVITADLTKLAQLRAGQHIQFKFVTLAVAQAALVKMDQQIRQLKQTLTFKYNA